MVCAAINVWCVASSDGSSCADSGNASRPVLFFLHGGAFILGSAKHPYAAPDPAALVAATGAVYVKSQYRLGALGFLAHPAMPIEGAGQFGLNDQLLAIRWTKKHAVAFGGDPDALTVSGASAGAISLCFHLSNPATKGLYRTAILQSPQCAYPFPGLEESFDRARRLARAGGCAHGGPDASRLTVTVRRAYEALELGDPERAGWRLPAPVLAHALDALAASDAAEEAASTSEELNPAQTGTQTQRGAARRPPVVTPEPEASLHGPVQSAQWRWPTAEPPARDPAVAEAAVSKEGLVSLFLGGAYDSLPLVNGTVVPMPPAPATAPQMAAELLCMHRLSGQAVVEAMPARRATFWYEGDMFFPVVNGADAPYMPGESLARRGLADPELTLLTGTQRSEGTLFAVLAFPVFADADLILMHLRSAFGKAQSELLWQHYFPPTKEELLLEGPGGEYVAPAGPAGVAESAAHLLEEVEEEVAAAVGEAADRAMAALDGRVWRQAGRVRTRTPHHGSAPTVLSGPMHWLSNALGAHEWTAIAHLLSDVWRCGFLENTRRIAALSAAASLARASPSPQNGPSHSQVRGGAGDEAEVGFEVEVLAGGETAPGGGAAFDVREDASPLGPVGSDELVPSRLYAYHMLHAPASVRWPGHRLGAFHGSEVPLFYNSTLVKDEDRVIAEHMLPLLNRTLWEGRPSGEGECQASGVPASGGGRGSWGGQAKGAGRAAVWCPVAVPRAAADNAAARLAGGGSFELEAPFTVGALHITGKRSSLGMRPFLHEQRDGHWVCEEVMRPLFDGTTVAGQVPGQTFEPLLARFANVALPKVAAAVVRRPTIRILVLGGLAVLLAATILGCCASSGFRRCCCFCCCSSLCWCWCCCGCLCYRQCCSSDSADATGASVAVAVAGRPVLSDPAGATLSSQ